MTYQQIVYVTVKLTLIGNSTPYEVMEDCDYSFNHEAIVDSEIIGLSEE
jgi:hypothetical protein